MAEKVFSVILEDKLNIIEYKARLRTPGARIWLLLASLNLHHFCGTKWYFCIFALAGTRIFIVSVVVAFICARQVRAFGSFLLP